MLTGLAVVKLHDDDAAKKISVVPMVGSGYKKRDVVTTGVKRYPRCRTLIVLTVTTKYAATINLS
jgi:hypothetical protein